MPTIDEIQDLLRKEPGDVFLNYSLAMVQKKEGLDDEALASLMAGCDTLLVDGTFFTETEMIDQGVGTKTAASMGHLPQSGERGMLAELARFADKRRILIHINNTNPILDPDSPERATVTAAGVEVAYDGMEIQP